MKMKLVVSKVGTNRNTRKSSTSAAAAAEKAEKFDFRKQFPLDWTTVERAGYTECYEAPMKTNKSQDFLDNIAKVVTDLGGTEHEANYGINFKIDDQSWYVHENKDSETIIAQME